MDANNSSMAASAISHAADMVKIAWQEAAWEQMRPSVVFKPRLFRDGNMWCALFGENLQEGVAGFGPRPCDAMWAFDRAWLSENGSHVIDRKEPPPCAP
jgi:hypothetical protein